MPRRILEGEVISNKTDKTITVLVERRYMHPIYKKYIKKSSKYAAHDGANSCQVGDRVQIIECRPISKTKRWTLVGGEEPAAAGKNAEKGAAKEVKKPAAKKEAAPKAAAEKKTVAKEDKPAAKKAPAKKPAAKKETKSEKKDK